MWYDVAMLAILAYTTIRGSAKGMAWQVAAIAALVLCFAFATPLSLVVAPAIRLDPPLNRWVAMLGIYLVFSFGCFALARVLRSWLESLKFEEYDRHLGALFGFVKGATICLVVTFFTVCLSESSRDYVLRTRSGRLAGRVLDQLTLVMPTEFDRLVAPYLRNFTDASPVADEGGVTEGDLALGEEDSHDGFRGSRRGDDATDERRPQGMLDGVVDSLEDAIKDGVRDFVTDALGNKTDDRDEDSSSEDDLPESSRVRQTDDVQDATSVAKERLDRLTSDVCRILASDPRRREVLQAEIETLLRGVPARPVAAALEDWKSDLRGDSQDPDGETDAATSLDLRLWRQLEAAEVDDLPRPVRERLEEAASR